MFCLSVLQYLVTQAAESMSGHHSSTRLGVTPFLLASRINRRPLLCLKYCLPLISECRVLYRRVAVLICFVKLAGTDLRLAMLAACYAWRLFDVPIGYDSIVRINMAAHQPAHSASQNRLPEMQKALAYGFRCTRTPFRVRIHEIRLSCYSLRVQRQ